MYRLALGSEISDFGLTWGVWDGTSQYLPIQVSIRALHKEINEKYRDFWSPLVVSLSLSHTHIGLLLIFRRASPSLLHGRSPPPGKNLDCFRTYESTCNVNMFFFSESKQEVYYVMGISQRSLPRNRFLDVTQRRDIQKTMRGRRKPA